MVVAYDRRFSSEFFAQAAADREQLLRDALARSGVDCLELATDEPLDLTLKEMNRVMDEMEAVLTRRK